MSNHLLSKLLLLAGILIGFSTCEKGSLTTPTDGLEGPTAVELRNGRATENLFLDITGLEDLGGDFIYEGWIIVGGQPYTTGTFMVDGSGLLSEESFSVDQQLLNQAGAFVLTIEPYPDNDPAPSAVHILAGNFDNQQATLNIGHPAAIGSNFTTASGKYILATPTNGAESDEKSGVWFLKFSGGNPVPALNLPELPAGWAYEGWAVINGVPVTSGKFTSVSEVDFSAPFSGQQPGPPFPGEDFLNNAPAGLSFPVDLSEDNIVISVEPVPDNSPAPFLLKPLVGKVPANADDHVPYVLRNFSNNNPSGMASRLGN